MSIPVIGTAVVKNPYWVTRLLMSIDYPVENFVVINNNGTGEIEAELDKLKYISHNFVQNIKVCHLPSNIGCAGAWNLIIKSYMMCPYWVIVNDDVSFGVGFLSEMVSVANSDQDIGMIHGHPGDSNLGSWDLFLIRDYIIQQFGLFDENFYPAYCEDLDYLMRFMHRPIKKVISLNANYYHGNGDKTQYNTEGSQTKKHSIHLEKMLEMANTINHEYLQKKWGNNLYNYNPTNLPFSGLPYPISATSYDLEFVRRKHTGF